MKLLCWLVLTILLLPQSLFSGSTWLHLKIPLKILSVEHIERIIPPGEVVKWAKYLGSDLILLKIAEAGGEEIRLFPYPPDKQKSYQYIDQLAALCKKNQIRLGGVFLTDIAAYEPSSAISKGLNSIYGRLEKAGFSILLINDLSVVEHNKGVYTGPILTYLKDLRLRTSLPIGYYIIGSLFQAEKIAALSPYVDVLANMAYDLGIQRPQSTTGLKRVLNMLAALTASTKTVVLWNGVGAGVWLIEPAAPKWKAQFGERDIAQMTFDYILTSLHHPGVKGVFIQDLNRLLFWNKCYQGMLLPAIREAFLSSGMNPDPIRIYNQKGTLLWQGARSTWLKIGLTQFQGPAILKVSQSPNGKKVQVIRIPGPVQISIPRTAPYQSGEVNLPVSISINNKAITQLDLAVFHKNRVLLAQTYRLGVEPAQTVYFRFKAPLAQLVCKLSFLDAQQRKLGEFISPLQLHPIHSPILILQDPAPENRTEANQWKALIQKTVGITPDQLEITGHTENGISAIFDYYRLIITPGRWDFPAYPIRKALLDFAKKGRGLIMTYSVLNPIAKYLNLKIIRKHVERRHLKIIGSGLIKAAPQFYPAEGVLFQVDPPLKNRGQKIHGQIHYQGKFLSPVCVEKLNNGRILACFIQRAYQYMEKERLSSLFSWLLFQKESL